MQVKLFFEGLNQPKPEIIEPKAADSLLNLNDNIIRYSLIPLLGIGISHAFQLYSPFGIENLQYWIGITYFIFLSFCIWQGNRYFLFQQRKHYSWFRQPARKLALLLFANIFYTAPLTVLFLWGWYQQPVYADTPWSVIQQIAGINVIAVIFITHVYETIFLIREREQDLVRVSQLQQAQTQAQLNALKAQIDPHFMFNSLNTLHYLINQDAKKARLFTQNLSDVYRYILMHKDDKLVTLAEELEFSKNYLQLMEVRFGKAFTLNQQIPKQEYLIPPVSLQVLLENIFKHNSFTENAPVQVSLLVKNEKLQISNNMISKKEKEPSTGLGLQNLSERFRLVTGKAIQIKSNSSTFAVTLPLLPIT